MLIKSTNILVLAIFSAWIAVFGFEILVASQQPPTQQQGHGTNAAEGYTKGAGSITFDNSHPDEQASKRKSKERQTTQALKEFFINFFDFKLTDFLIAIFTIVLAVKTSGLFRETAGLRAAADQQARDMRDSIKEARRAADAANKSAKIAEDSLVKLQRAFVSIRQIKYLSHLNTATQKVYWTFHVEWENSGVSPTRQFKVYVGRFLEDFDIPDSFEFKVPENRPVNLLGPKATMLSGELAVSGTDLVAVQEGEKFLYFWGRADYRDVFPDTPDHVTKFFMRVDLRGDPTKAWDANNILELILIKQPKHNCADEECG